MTDSALHLTLQQQLSESFGTHVKALSFDHLAEQLALLINNLILNDMNRLWNILYRVDIEEATVLKIMGENSTGEASRLLAEALISRQLQKIKSRKNNSSTRDIPEDEKW